MWSVCKRVGVFVVSLVTTVSLTKMAEHVEMLTMILTQLDPVNHVSVRAYYGVKPRQQVIDKPRIDTVNFVRKMT